jgi:hypothetical protein
MSPTEWVADPSATLEWFRAELADAHGIEPWPGCHHAITALERALSLPSAIRSDWRQQLIPMLKGIGPLLPGGPDKRPLVGNEWDDHPGLSTTQLQAAAPSCVCWHIGASETHIGIDIDGTAPAAFCQSHGCDPFSADTWRIIRTSDAKRLKLVFTVTPEQKEVLAAATQKSVKFAGREVALFAAHGHQIIVCGDHFTKESNYTEQDDQYAWSGRAPAEAQPLPPKWFALLTGLFCGDRPLKPATRRTVTPSKRSSSTSGWSNSSTRQPCPVCGRSHSGACAIHGDGESVWCCHGETCSAPDCSKPGERITGRDGRAWGYVRTEEHDCFGERSLFKLHKPRSRPAHAANATAAPQLAPAEAAADHAEPAAAAPSAGSVVSKKTRVGSEEVLTLLPYYLGQIRLNVRSGEVHSSAKGVISANEISRLYLELSRPFEVWPKDATADGITLLASRNPFDPVREWLESLEAEPLPMEQWQRLDAHMLGIDDPIAANFLPRYLISAVARTMEPGCYVRQAPVLIGAQERGKSELGRILFGAENWVEGVGALDRDALMKSHTAWGVELAELDGVSRRSDQEALKAFLTEVADTYRKPYDRAPERHPRRFVFWGSANRPPLRDPSGSTRFVCIPIPDRPLPLEWARQNRDALWARAVQQYRSGVTWLRTSEAERLAVEARNSDFTELDPWADPVAEFLRRAQSERRLPVRVPEVLAHLEVPKERQTTATAKRVREIAEGQGWRHARRWVGRDRPQGLWPPSDGHPGHTPDTPRGVCSDPSDASGSRHVGHPRHPYSQTVEEVGRWQESGTPATHPAPITQEVLSPEGCPVCPQPQTDCSGAELAKPGGVSIGVSGGVSIPTTVADWCEVALAELRLAPDPRHLPEVHDWLQRHPAAPGCTRTALAAALERLRQEDAHDQPTLLETP